MPLEARFTSLRTVIRAIGQHRDVKGIKFWICDVPHGENATGA